MARISAWLRALVWVIQQAICGLRQPLGEERERHRGLVAGLHLQPRPVDGPPVQPRRRAGLEPAEAQAEPKQALGQAHGRAVADPARRPALLAEMDLAAQEGAGGQDHRARAPIGAGAVDHARDPAGLDEQILDLGLAQVEAGLGVEQRAHGPRVELAVGLGARALHRRPLAAVEHPELDAAGIDRAAP